MSMRIGIVGAGPAGMTAALHAARRGCDVHLIDSNPAVGRKLLVTGAGRCNLSNRGASPANAARYACPDPAFVQVVLSRFGRADLLAFLRDLGVLTFDTDDGWTYPVSESAAAVTAIFAAALREAGVTLHLNTLVTGVERRKTGFRLAAGSLPAPLEVEALIVASGGKAYPALGSTGSLYPHLERLGQPIIPLYPALAPVLADVRRLHRLQGVRLDAGVSLFSHSKLIAQTTGNLIFTQWGLNGPAVMDLSHHLNSLPAGSTRLDLDLNPFHRNELLHLVRSKRKSSYPVSTLLGAVLPPKVPPVLLALAGLRGDPPLAQLSASEVDAVLHLLSHLPIAVSGVKGFDACQVSAGGVDVGAVDAATLQSRRIPGLYFCGEVLDVTGPCGGYNLQFAFSSGAVAGISAGEMDR